MAKASDNLFPYVHLTPAAAPASPAAGAERLYLDSADGNKLKRKNSAGTVTTIEGGAGSSGQGLKDFDRKKRTSGNVTISATTFTDVDTALDLVLTAAAGDVIEVGVVAKVEKSTSGNTYYVSDFHTIVSGSPVNSVTSESAAGTGLTNSFPGWAYGIVNFEDAANFRPNQLIAGTKRYVVQAGDVSAGTVTLRYRAFVGAAVIVNAADPMLYVHATNLGPQL